MKAIYSFSGIPFIEKEGERFAGGFNSPEEFISCAKESVNSARLSFNKIELYVDSKGAEILAPLLPLFDEVIEIDCIEEDSYFFAQSKIYAYLLQTQPFIHIDFDLILHQKVDFNDIELIVEFAEFYKYYKENGYKYLLNAQTPIKLVVDQFSKGIKNPLAYCTGVFGGSNLDLIHEYAHSVIQVLKDVRASRIEKDLKFALWVEQGLVSSICGKYGISPYQMFYNGINYTHYNGSNKALYKMV